MSSDEDVGRIVRRLVRWARLFSAQSGADAFGEPMEPEFWRIARTGRIVRYMELAGVPARNDPETDRYLETRSQYAEQLYADFQVLLAELVTVKCAPFKGFALSAALYGDPLVRLNVDIDLVASEVELYSIHRILIARGYWQSISAIGGFHNEHVDWKGAVPIRKASGRLLADYIRSKDDWPQSVEVHLATPPLDPRQLDQLFDQGESSWSAPDLSRLALLFVLDKHRDFRNGVEYVFRDIVDIARAKHLLASQGRAPIHHLAAELGCENQVEAVLSLSEALLLEPLMASARRPDPFPWVSTNMCFRIGDGVEELLTMLEVTNARTLLGAGEQRFEAPCGGGIDLAWMHTSAGLRLAISSDGLAAKTPFQIDFEFIRGLQASVVDRLLIIFDPDNHNADTSCEVHQLGKVRLDGPVGTMLIEPHLVMGLQNSGAIGARLRVQIAGARADQRRATMDCTNSGILLRLN